MREMGEVQDNLLSVSPKRHKTRREKRHPPPPRGGYRFVGKHRSSQANVTLVRMDVDFAECSVFPTGAANKWANTQVVSLSCVFILQSTPMFPSISPFYVARLQISRRSIMHEQNVATIISHSNSQNLTRSWSSQHKQLCLPTSIG